MASGSTRLEHVLKMLDLRRTVVRPQHRDHVKSAGTILKPTFHQKISSRVFDPSHLRDPQRFLQVLRVITSTALDLDKYDRVVV